MGKQQFNVYLDPDLVRRVKHRAIDEGCSLSELVSRCLEKYLQKQEPDHA
ncbi:MAG: CopG family transcriptional regulator [Bowdeniella nasicola]|nr:CopG family transcriptional regulator [Bowdeniella nasicola]